MTTLRDELAFAIELAQHCAGMAMTFRGHGRLDLQEKPEDEGPVTAADTAINDHVVASIERRFPGDAMVTEERAAEPGWTSARRCWHVDPIDGTREFADGDDSFAIHIGLAIDGLPVLGVVAEPAVDRLTWGLVTARPSGAVRERGVERPLAVSARELAELHMTSSKSHRSDRMQAVLQALDITADRAHTTGSVGVKVGRIARGLADVYVHPTVGTKVWDTCAPEAILLAAGGRVTDLRGAPLSYRGPEPGHARGLVATHGRCHDQVVERLAALSAAWFPA